MTGWIAVGLLFLGAAIGYFLRRFADRSAYDNGYDNGYEDGTAEALRRQGEELEGGAS